MAAFAIGVAALWGFVYITRDSTASIVWAWIAVLATLAGFIMFPVFIWYVILIILACVLLTLFVAAIPYIIAAIIGVAFVYFAIISLDAFLKHVIGG